MSRIFEALSRAEKQNGGATPGAAPVDADLLFGLLRTAEKKMGKLQGTPRINYTPQVDHPVAAVDPALYAGTESFRLLRHRLERMREQRALRSLLITSAIPKEGKTLVSVNLATTLAHTSDRVLLIDADLRRPNVERTLGLRVHTGLVDCLFGKSTLLAACRQVDPLGFYILSAGQVSTEPGDLLLKRELQPLLKEAMEQFEWVVVDSPPVIPFSDGLHLANMCDAVLLVAREGVTPRDDLQQAIKSLKGTPLVGVVWNGSKPSRETYYSGYYASNLPIQGQSQVADSTPVSKEK